MLLLLTEKGRFPSELANKFDVNLAIHSTHLRALRCTSLVIEKMEAQTLKYTLRRQNSLKIKYFFDRIRGDRIQSLKEYVETKNKRTGKRVGSAMK